MKKLCKFVSGEIFGLVCAVEDFACGYGQDYNFC